RERDAERDLNAAELGAFRQPRIPDDAHADVRKVDPDRHENDARDDRWKDLAKLAHDPGENAFRYAGDEDHAGDHGPAPLPGGDGAPGQMAGRPPRRTEIARAKGRAADRLQQRVDGNGQHRHRHEADGAVGWKPRRLHHERHQDEIGADRCDVLEPEPDPAPKGRALIKTVDEIRGLLHAAASIWESALADHSNGFQRSASASLAPSAAKAPAKARRIQVNTAGREITLLRMAAANRP